MNGLFGLIYPSLRVHSALALGKRHGRFLAIIILLCVPSSFIGLKLTHRYYAHKECGFGISKIQKFILSEAMFD